MVLVWCNYGGIILWRLEEEGVVYLVGIGDRGARMHSVRQKITEGDDDWSKDKIRLTFEM